MQYEKMIIEALFDKKVCFYGKFELFFWVWEVNLKPQKYTLVWISSRRHVTPGPSILLLASSSSESHFHTYLFTTYPWQKCKSSNSQAVVTFVVTFVKSRHWAKLTLLKDLNPNKNLDEIWFLWSYQCSCVLTLMFHFSLEEKFLS